MPKCFPNIKIDIPMHRQKTPKCPTVLISTVKAMVSKSIHLSFFSTGIINSNLTFEWCQVKDWIVSPKHTHSEHICVWYEPVFEVLTSRTYECDIFWNTVLRHHQVKIESLEWTPIHDEWFLYKKKRQRHSGRLPSDRWQRPEWFICKLRNSTVTSNAQKEPILFTP